MRFICRYIIGPTLSTILVLPLAAATALHEMTESMGRLLLVGQSISGGAGYSALDRSAESIAAARHLLETMLRRSILVRPLRLPAPGSRPMRPRPTPES